MFNFLFDGKIGDILAPVVPSNQLFLAIQHHKNDQILGLLSSTGYNGHQQANGNYSAIHVACRYNNRYALDILVQRGTSLQLQDHNGDTPLHYAAKYGHLDLCKYLVDNGVSAALRNKQQKTAYDVAESHLVRQYLLPVVLQAERGSDPNNLAPPPAYITQQPSSTPMAAAPAPALNKPVFPTFTGNQQLPVVTSGIATGAQSSNNVPANYYAAPPPNYSLNQLQNKTAASTGSNRIIQPDGFHSSASDPVLQQKYGHIIEQKHVAPPPTGPTTSFSQNTIYTQQGGSIYNRYVPYDINNSTAAAAPSSSHVPVASNPSVYIPPTAPHTQHPPQQPYSAASLPTPPTVTNPQVLPSPVRFLGVPQSAVNQQTNTNATHAGSAPSSGTPTTVNRLLGNKAVAVDISTADENLSPISRPMVDSPSSGSKQNISFSRDDGEVIQATSHSSSVL